MQAFLADFTFIPRCLALKEITANKTPHVGSRITKGSFLLYGIPEDAQNLAELFSVSYSSPK